ncbi:hypothetical protein [Lysobacter sp. A378]
MRLHSRRNNHRDDRAPRVPAWHRWLAVVLAIGGVAALLVARQPISQWLWPDTRIQQLRIDAAQALGAGELSRADGRGARELYEAALALDPDRIGARDGLVAVGNAALARANAAIEQGHPAEARDALQLARDLAVPTAQTDALEARLRKREVDATGVDRLLSEAVVARGAGHLDGDAGAALPLFERVLALQPNNIAALEGREDTLADLLQQARKAVNDADLSHAARLVARVQAVDPGHVDLPQTLAELGAGIERRLAKADDDLAGRELVAALAGYDQVATIYPGNTAAVRGRVRVADAHAARSRRYAADFQLRPAQAELLAAEAIAPQAAAVVAARRYLTEARVSQARFNDGVPSAAQRRRVLDLLAAAGAAEARGDLLLPPGESAYDKLRTARAIAPRDPAVLAMAARLRPAAWECFEQALPRNRLTTAGACLDAYAVLEGDDGAMRKARRRLALRWIAVGDERLGAGELPAARHALDTARALDPLAEGMEAFAHRVRAASIVAD